MNLQQLRYLCAIADAGLNVSRAGERLHTSQPGISKQVRLLEEELGVALFQRRGKHLQSLTPVGQQVLEHARAMLERANAIRQTAAESLDERRGALSIATTHTQSRYSLPPVLTRFVHQYPEVQLHMQQGTPAQVAELAARGEVDFAIATEALSQFETLVVLPCFQWNRVVLVPKGHPLASAAGGRGARLELEQLARYPLVTYIHGFTGREKLDEAFAAHGLQPNIVFTAADADVIKTYVRLGMGVGITASMALEPGRDEDLVALDASHLFDWSTTSIALRRETWLRGYMYDFIGLLAPQLDRQTVDAFMQASDRGSLERLEAALSVPRQHLSR